MENQTMEILKLMASFLTPLILLIFGISINRRLEESKTVLWKEKDWQNWWAGKFLGIAHAYNEHTTKIVTGLFQAHQIAEEKLPGWENEEKEKKHSINHDIRQLQLLDWEFMNYAQFAQKQGDAVLERQKNYLNYCPG